MVNEEKREAPDFLMIFSEFSPASIFLYIFFKKILLEPNDNFDFNRFPD